MLLKEGETICTFQEKHRMYSVVAHFGFAVSPYDWSSGDFALLCTILLMPGDIVGEPLNTSAYFSVCNLRDINAQKAAMKQVL